MQQLQRARDADAAQRRAAADWQRHITCSALPDPRCRPQLNAFLTTLVEASACKKADMTCSNGLAAINAALAQAKVWPTFGMSAVHTTDAVRAGLSALTAELRLPTNTHRCVQQLHRER